ncbi:(d)CMP kinase [Trueperella bernardiae]|uniref:Cytidylate kinase n=1 Tax=Trueperella bernardiae TaxID=59561 RepID=A0AAW6ZI64_9ACTO|nr:MULTISPECIES: (d)CMP kinase [Trueperella]MCM3906613.1 (d)CMP kinase [Trueperella bernardiae]MDK8601115.1 (d)CMP kinase [Trueperella bernardiae]WIM08898.1 (d)CMP kinase [Trueperella bernardiae]
MVRSESPKPLVIAIDGPSGSGKSTVAKRVARELGLSYLDTGAMYRAATWWAMHEGIDLDDADSVLAATQSMPLSIDLDPDNQRFMCADHDITAAIRTSEVAKVVSKLAVNLGVRAEMVRMQQAIIAEETTASGHSQGRGIVAEGRDITTVVAADAPVRVLLTASEEARLARRAKENLGAADQAAIAATRDEVLRRDRDDSTVINFTVAEDGVTTIDSSALGIDEVVAAVIALIPEGYRD